VKIYDPFTSLLGSGGQLFQTLFLRPADFNPEIIMFKSFKVDDAAYRSIALELLYQTSFECEMIRVVFWPEIDVKSRGRADLVRVNCVSNQVIISLRPRWNHCESLTVTIGFDVDVWPAFQRLQRLGVSPSNNIFRKFTRKKSRAEMNL
jgi:hypothetical protein